MIFLLAQEIKIQKNLGKSKFDPSGVTTTRKHHTPDVTGDIGIQGLRPSIS